MSMNATGSTYARDLRPVIWDPLVRAAHWILVAAFAVSYLTAEDESATPAVLHVWGGYVVGGIIVLRVLWGFVGPQHARFSDFVYSPVRVVRYLIDLPMGRGTRYLGHSPAGGTMVIALLACLAATVITGLMAYGEQGKGPLATASPAIVAEAHADADNNRTAAASPREPNGEGQVEELHDVLANITLALVVLHVLGVGVASVAHRENLVASMIHGRKRAGETDGRA